MTNFIKFSILFFISIVTFETSNGQKIEYGFGKGSEVIDTIQKAINWYKEKYAQSDIKKLNLYVGIDYCDGNLSLSISQYADDDRNMARLVKNSGRFIL